MKQTDLSQVFFMLAGPYQMMKWLNVVKDPDHILDTKKKSRIFKGPTFNIFSMTMAHWLTLLRSNEWIFMNYYVGMT